MENITGVMENITRATKNITEVMRNITSSREKSLKIRSAVGCIITASKAQ